MIFTKKLSHDYLKKDDEGNVIGKVRALDDVNVHVKPGEFVAILGHNGSGKSTFAKHINALLYPTEGTVTVDGMDTTNDNDLWKIRQEAGMIFQNPDNQIIGQVVEEDVGFGPENLGVPTKEIWERVEESLRAVGMYEYRKKSPNHLSGGQKQRVSIAAHGLNQVEGITILLITHYMEEAIGADRVIVMDQGKVAMEGTPREVFSHVEELRSLKLDVPEATMLAYKLQKAGLPLPDGILTKEELADALAKTGLFPEMTADKTPAGTADPSADKTSAGTADKSEDQM